MTEKTEEIRDKILLAALPHVVFDGWCRDTVKRAAVAAGYEHHMAAAVFPGGLSDVLKHFADWTDRQMMAALSGIDPQELRIRDRVQTAVMARLRVMEENRQAEKQAMSYWSMPHRTPQAAKMMWRTADKIWNWAGDTATDYNHYTKRGLLCGVMSGTFLVWGNNEADDLDEVEAFLERRISNVLKIGRAVGRFKKGKTAKDGEQAA